LFQRCLHFSCRDGCAAAILILVTAACGCALWERDRWNIDRYRDERAVDVERRLERTEPIVKNPF
jgi:hypothetical protein